MKNWTVKTWIFGVLLLLQWTEVNSEYIYSITTPEIMIVFFAEVSEECLEGNITVMEIHPDYAAGRIFMLCSNGEMRVVCHHGWDMHDARVACRELGYPEYGKTPNVSVSKASHISLQGHTSVTTHALVATMLLDLQILSATGMKQNFHNAHLRPLVGRELEMARTGVKVEN